ncbi:MAG TPA: tetratricopeptide repeat protein [Opitutaceae bacterium]|jgi:tetratricopeptide (TPR) repeat protein
MGAGLIVAATAAAYATSFWGAFQFDDLPAILENPTICRLWPLTVPLVPPVGALTVSGRPLLNLSFALNFAVSGYWPWSYHALNLLIHIGAALTLFGIVGRTLRRNGRSHPDGLALIVAVLWAVHPLTTESVTYVVQRAESFVGLCFLLTLYGFARATEPEQTRGPSFRWYLFSWLACLLGTGVKEVIVTAPAVVYLFDRTFVAKSWRGPWRQRKGYYMALAATWLPLLALVAWTGWNRGSTSGFKVGIPWWPYWRSQGEAVARYVGLSIWPHPLTFDYGPSTLGLAAANAWFGVLALGLIATVIGCWKGRPWAFLVASGLLVLSPTSVIPGVLQFVAEHRMYLPLAAVVTGGAVGIHSLLVRVPFLRRGRTVVALACAVAAAYGAVTARRNLVYRTDLALWLDTAQKRPADPLAQANVGRALFNRDRIDEAIAYSKRAIALNPLKPEAHFNLGLAYEQRKRWVDAVDQFEAAGTINPDMFFADFRAGRILNRLGRYGDAEPWLRRAVAIQPEDADAHGSLGVTLAALGHPREAVPEFERSLDLRSDQPEVEYDLALAWAGQGQPEQAMRHYAAAIRLDPRYGAAQLNFGIGLAQAGDLPAALKALQAAVRLLPASAVAHASLALALDQAGETEKAVSEFRAALRIQPVYPEAHYNLGNALLRGRDLRGADEEFQEAVRQKPDFGPAREMLNRLAPYLGS